MALAGKGVCSSVPLVKHLRPHRTGVEGGGMVEMRGLMECVWPLVIALAGVFERLGMACCV